MHRAARKLSRLNQAGRIIEQSVAESVGYDGTVGKACESSRKMASLGPAYEAKVWMGVLPTEATIGESGNEWTSERFRTQHDVSLVQAP